MAVNIDDVRRWWVIDGVGHALRGRCACGECEDPYLALCDMEGGGGEIVEAVPGRICSVCRARLARPGIIAMDGQALPRRGGMPRPTVNVQVIHAGALEDLPAPVAEYLRELFEGRPRDN